MDTTEKFLKKYANQRIFRAHNGNKMSLRVAKNGLSVRIDALEVPPITTCVVEEDFTRIVPNFNCILSNFKTKFAFILNQRVKHVDFHEEKIHVETNSTVSAISYSYVSNFSGRDFRIDVAALREIISLAEPITDCFVNFYDFAVDLFWINVDGTKVRVSSEATKIPKHFKYFSFEPPDTTVVRPYVRSKPIIAYLSVLSARRCAEVKVDNFTLSAVFFDSVIKLSNPYHYVIGDSFTINPKLLLRVMKCSYYCTFERNDKELVIRTDIASTLIK